MIPKPISILFGILATFIFDGLIKTNPKVEDKSENEKAIPDTGDSIASDDNPD